MEPTRDALRHPSFHNCGSLLNFAAGSRYGPAYILSVLLEARTHTAVKDIEAYHLVLSVASYIS